MLPAAPDRNPSSARPTLLRLRRRHHIGVPILRRATAGRKSLRLAPSAFRQDDRGRSVDVAGRSGVKHERAIRSGECRFSTLAPDTK
jgi:hypothetical protein